MHTHTHTHSYMLVQVSHTFSFRLPRHWWTTALPLCCTLLHLELWASCIFNRGNLHRHCVCRCILCQWDCLSPYLHSPLTLQLLFWGHINHRPRYRRLPVDIVFITHSDLREKRGVQYSFIHCTSPTVHHLLGLLLHLQEELLKNKILLLSPSATYYMYLLAAGELVF